MADDPLDWQLIDRYLAGHASSDEVAHVRARTKADPAWGKALELLRTDFAARPSAQWDTNVAWSRLRYRLEPDQQPATPLAHRSGGRRFATRSTVWRLAAGLVAVAGSLATWRTLAHRGGAAATPNATVAMREIVTPNGARQTVTLDDGSRVTLNAASRLRWAPGFTTRARDVYLDGEAYLVVTHDAARPFRVHTRGVIAHDLGTRFTVRAYAELPHVEVVVAEGSVSLRRAVVTADSAILGPGQLGRVGESGPPTIESNVPVERWTAWTGGSLVLDGLTLAEAIPQLERWYDATIMVTDPRLAGRRVSARFHDETLPQILDALSLALGARWQQSGRTITLAPLN